MLCPISLFRFLSRVQNILIFFKTQWKQIISSLKSGWLIFTGISLLKDTQMLHLPFPPLICFSVCFFFPAKWRRGGFSFLRRCHCNSYDRFFNNSHIFIPWNWPSDSFRELVRAGHGRQTDHWHERSQPPTIYAARVATGAFWTQWAEDTTHRGRGRTQSLSPTVRPDASKKHAVLYDFHTLWSDLATCMLVYPAFCHDINNHSNTVLFKIQFTYH